MRININNYQLPKGYKQTEVGVIPENWEVGDLKRFWSINDCKHITAKFVNSGIPIASIKEVQSRFVELDNAKQTTVSYYNQLIEGGRKPQSGDLIFSRNATVGEVAQVAVWHPPFAMGQDVSLLRKKSPELSTAFLQSVIQSWIVVDQLENMMVGSTFRRVNVEQIKNLTVPMPRPAEQEAIAQALSDVDTLIAALDELITKKRNLKTATMQQLLTGKKRLSGFGKGQGYKQSSIGVIPEDWDVRPMSSLATIQRGASPRPIDSPIWYDPQSTVGWVRISDITSSDGKLLRSTRDYLSTKGIAQSRFLPIGSLIMSICATVGIPVITQMDSCIHDGFVGFSNLQDVDQEFLYYKLKKLEPYFKFKGQTGSQSNINSNLVRDCEIALPLIPEQRAIATVLSDMDAEITALETRLAKTQSIKQGMMQELLTGRTRLV